MLFDSEVKESLERSFKRSGIKVSYYDGYIVKFDNTQTFEAGKIYEYDVVVGDSKAVLGNVTVSQWDDEVNAGNFVTE